MLPKIIQAKIDRIYQISSNYHYFQFTRKELQDLQIDITQILNDLNHYNNEMIIDLARDYQKIKNNLIIKSGKSPAEKIDEVESSQLQKATIAALEKDIREPSELAQWIAQTESDLSNFQNKIITRIDVLRDNIEYSEEERSRAYQKVLTYIGIGATKNEDLELLLISNQMGPTELELKEYGSSNPSLLVNAIKANNFPAVKMLCEVGAQINLTTEDEEYDSEESLEAELPLLAACRQNNVPIIDYLLSKGADPYLVPSEEENTCLTIALERKNFDLFKKLVNEHQIDFNRTCEYSDVETYNRNLRYLIDDASPEEVKVVIENVQNLDLNQIAHYSDDDKTFLTEAFLEGGIKFNDRYSNNEKKALLTEKEKQVYRQELAMFTEKFKMLVNEAGLDLNKQDNEGNTLLHYAFDSAESISVNSDCVKVLIDLGANLDIPNNHNVTARDFAKINPQDWIKALATIQNETLVRKNLNAEFTNLNINKPDCLSLAESEIINWNQPSTSKDTSFSRALISESENSFTANQILVEKTTVNTDEAQKNAASKVETEKRLAEIEIEKKQIQVEIEKLEAAEQIRKAKAVKRKTEQEQKQKVEEVKRKAEEAENRKSKQAKHDQETKKLAMPFNN